MGAEAIVVETVDDVGAALDKACETQKHGKTTVIEALCTMELGDPFRRDALKKPLRLLDKYRHTNVE
jgi:sulfoacetaldehyde acetyltransferase